MESFNFLLFLAIILVSTKVLGIFSKKVKMPQVVGALVAGVILGPSVLNLVQMESDGNFLAYMAVRRKMTLPPCVFTWHPCAKNWNDTRMRRI